MSVEEIKSTRQVRNRKYTIIKRKFPQNEIRLATMQRETIQKSKFLPTINIPTDFICSKCKQEIDGRFVFITMTDREYITVIRVEKPIFHLNCIDYNTDEPIIGILNMTDERNALNESRQDEFNKRKSEEKEIKAKKRDKELTEALEKNAKTRVEVEKQIRQPRNKSKYKGKKNE